MSQSDSPTIAYYTVVEDERTGWTGGLLLLDRNGRPLEFQCTLPVRPSRAHEILFGPTLRSHLIGEVIGPLLISKCRTPIMLLCCDQPEALNMATSAGFPMAWVDQATEQEKRPITDEAMMGFVTVPLAGSTLRVVKENVDQVRAMTSRLADLPDASEPFERIREAIKEAQSQIARATTAPPQTPTAPTSAAPTARAGATRIETDSTA